MVHIFFNDASIIAPLFLKLHGLKVIISRRDMGYWYTASRLAILKLNGMLIDHVVVNSIAVKDKTNKCEGVKKNKISVIYNGYDNVDLFSNENEIDFLQYGIKETDLVLGLVANIRPLKLPARMNGGGPARYVRIAGTELRIGFITPISQHFCETCNRVRLSTDGTLYMCLGQDDQYPLRDYLRQGCSDEELKAHIQRAINLKPERHEFKEHPEKVIRFMSATGG